jgi:cytochrome d ubiquinol oxidase subunit II
MEYFLGIDYPTLWFLVIGLLFSGYAILEGFDFGAGAWHLFFQRFKPAYCHKCNCSGLGCQSSLVGYWWRCIICWFSSNVCHNAVGNVRAFMLFLMFNVLRAAAIKFRSAEEMLWWRKTWDIVYSVSSIMIAFLLGVVLGNILQGFPLGENHSYKGGVFFF